MVIALLLCTLFRSKFIVKKNLWEFVLGIFDPDYFLLATVECMNPYNFQVLFKQMFYTMHARCELVCQECQ